MLAPAAGGSVLVSPVPSVLSMLLGWLLSLKSIYVPRVVSEQHLVQRWACRRSDTSESPAVGAKVGKSFHAGK